MIRLLTFAMPLVAGMLLGLELGLYVSGVAPSVPSLAIAGVLAAAWWWA